jgi:hypothetical protein
MEQKRFFLHHAQSQYRTAFAGVVPFDKKLRQIDPRIPKGVIGLETENEAHIFLFGTLVAPFGSSVWGFGPFHIPKHKELV